MLSIARCFRPSKAKHPPGFQDHIILASETAFNVNEVDALYILFEQLSSSVFDDGLIHKEEFCLALFSCRSKQNLLAKRLFDQFDVKRNGAIGFEEFVRSLSMFHPDAPETEKVAFAFRLYDLRQTGFIEREGLKEMVLATLRESELSLSDDVVEAIVQKTLQEADSKGDGKIDMEEWKELVAKNPSLIKNMTLPYLREITLAFPSFVMETEVPDSELDYPEARLSTWRPDFPSSPSRCRFLCSKKAWGRCSRWAYWFWVRAGNGGGNQA